MGQTKVLAVDFETTSLDVKNTLITEVGAAWGLGENDYFSQFCYEPDYPPQTKFIEELTGITDAMLLNQGRSRKDVLERDLIPRIAAAETILAHRAAFDKAVFESTCNALGLTYPKDKLWLCTLSECPWPKRITCHKLSHLSFEFGLFDPPSEFKRDNLHRAGYDAKLLFALIDKLDVQKCIEYAKQPWHYFKADCLPPWKDEGLQNGIAKQMGFTWERVKYSDTIVAPKTWVQRVKDLSKMRDIEDQIAKSLSPFRVSEI